METKPKPYTPFVPHRRPPGLWWWVDLQGKAYGPYVHKQPAQAAARALRRDQLKTLEAEMGVAS